VIPRLPRLRIFKQPDLQQLVGDVVRIAVIITFSQTYEQPRKPLSMDSPGSLDMLELLQGTQDSLYGY
jgi:hypothetical protein